jgi:hypothetical protein
MPSAGTLSSNAADMTSSHALRNILMTDFSPIPAEHAPPKSDGARLPCPNFTFFGKENFTKNIKGKVTVIVNKCESIVDAIRGGFEPSEGVDGARIEGKEALPCVRLPVESIPLAPEVWVSRQKTANYRFF